MFRAHFEPIAEIGEDSFGTGLLTHLLGLKCPLKFFYRTTVFKERVKSVFVCWFVCLCLSVCLSVCFFVGLFVCLLLNGTLA